MPFRFLKKDDDASARPGGDLTGFAPDPGVDGPPRTWSEHDTQRLLGAVNPRYSAYLADAASASYDRGLFRVLLPGGVPDLVAFNAAEGWTAEWPEFRGLRAFAYDWLGRLYVADADGSWTKPGSVVRFTPALGEVETPTAKAISVDAFLFEALPKNRRDWLSADYFDDWLATGGSAPSPTECISYKVPLALGGDDDLPNLEVSDMAVYLSLSGQVHRQVAGLPEGTPIDSIALD
jgi:hypothetical protein